MSTTIVRVRNDKFLANYGLVVRYYKTLNRIDVEEIIYKNNADGFETINPRHLWRGSLEQFERAADYRLDIRFSSKDPQVVRFLPEVPEKQTKIEYLQYNELYPKFFEWLDTQQSAKK